MYIHIKTFLFLLLLGNVTIGCQPGSSHTDKEEHHDTAQIEAHSFIHLTAAQQKTVGLTLDTIQKRALHHSVQISGQLAIPPQYKAEVSAFIGGTVKQISVNEGEKVRKGQLLATLQDPKYIDLQQSFQEVSGDLQYLKQEYQRKKTLYEREVSSAKAYQKAKASYQKAEARYNGLAEKLRLLGRSPQAVANGKISATIPLRAPIAGFITSIHVSTGQYVTPEMSLLELSNNDYVFADFKVFDRDINQIKIGDTVQFTVTNSPDIVLHGPVYSIGKELDENKKAVHVHAKIRSTPAHLLPGMSIHGRILLDQQKVSAVPNDAIVSSGGKSFIFVQHNGREENATTIFKRTEITTGKSEQGYTEIKPVDSIPPEAVVVTTGAYYLQSDMEKEGFEHDD